MNKKILGLLLCCGFFSVQAEEIKLLPEQTKSFAQQQAQWMAERKKQLTKKLDNAIESLPLISLEEL